MERLPATLDFLQFFFVPLGWKVYILNSPDYQYDSSDQYAVVTGIARSVEASGHQEGAERRPVAPGHHLSECTRPALSLGALRLPCLAFLLANTRREP